MSKIKVLYTDPNHSLGANKDYFYVLSSCCTAFTYWRGLGEHPERFCSSCGSVSSVLPIQPAVYAVWRARRDPVDFKEWTDSWFPGMEVSFDD